MISIILFTTWHVDNEYCQPFNSEYYQTWFTTRNNFIMISIILFTILCHANNEYYQTRLTRRNHNVQYNTDHYEVVTICQHWRLIRNKLIFIWFVISIFLFFEIHLYINNFIFYFYFSRHDAIGRIDYDDTDEACSFNCPLWILQHYVASSTHRDQESGAMQTNYVCLTDLTCAS